MRPMSEAKREVLRLANLTQTLIALGFSGEDVAALRRASNGLQKWFERECNGDVERDEATGKTFAVIGRNTYRGTIRRSPTRDLESGHRRRIAAIMAAHPTLRVYIQSDPRGASLYILRPGDVPAGEDDGAWYSRGICVY